MDRHAIGKGGREIYIHIYMCVFVFLVLKEDQIYDIGVQIGSLQTTCHNASVSGSYNKTPLATEILISLLIFCAYSHGCMGLVFITFCER